MAAQAEAVTPFWAQPSHPDIQEVRYADASTPGAFMTKSYARIHVPPFGCFATLDFPPCTRATRPTYATVQMGREAHLNLNSDLLYINHSCDPSLIFDIPTLSILAGPKGLAPGDELTFFYPSTEWAMAQSFSCICASPHCKGRISGARDMAPHQLQGVWLNGFIRELLAEKDAAEMKGASNGTNNVHATNGTNGMQSTNTPNDTTKMNNPNCTPTPNGTHAIKSTPALIAHNTPTQPKLHSTPSTTSPLNHGDQPNGTAVVPAAATATAEARANGRSGPTSRELSGEMGGDTTAVVV